MTLARRVQIVRVLLITAASAVGCALCPQLWLFAASWLFAAPLFLWCCCPVLTCAEVDDGFDTDTRANYDAIGAGTYTHSAGTNCGLTGYVETSDDDAYIVHTSEVGPSGGAVQVQFCYTAYGTKLRLLGAWTDDDNHLIVELEFVASLDTKLSLFEKVAGTETQLGATLTTASFSATNSAHQIALVWNGSYACVRNTSSPSPGAIHYQPTTLNDTRGGVGVSDNAGTVRIGRFLLEYHAEDRSTCRTCVCSGSCDERTQGLQVQVDVIGVVNGVCATCSAFNTTTICDIGGNGDCAYPDNAAFSTACAGGGNVDVRASPNTTGWQTSYVWGAGSRMEWENTLTQPYDCTQAHSDLTNTENNITGCNVASSSSSVTPL